MNIGRMDCFDSTVEDWSAYVERLEQYCVANDVEEEKKVAVLLSLMGAKTYNLLRNLTIPDKPSEKTFQQNVDLLKCHLEPKPLVIAGRFRFHKRSVKDGVYSCIYGGAAEIG